MGVGELADGLQQFVVALAPVVAALPGCSLLLRDQVGAGDGDAF
jgi:hypothetical protein